MGKKSKEAKKRGKKQRTGKKHSSVKTHSFYELSGDTATRKKKACPRCGQGTWLGEHKGRLYCGKCGYTEFQRTGAPQEEKPTEQPTETDEPKESVEEKPAEEKKEESGSEEKPEKKKE